VSLTHLTVPGVVHVLTSRLARHTAPLADWTDIRPTQM